MANPNDSAGDDLRGALRNADQICQGMERRIMTMARSIQDKLNFADGKSEADIRELLEVIEETSRSAMNEVNATAERHGCTFKESAA